MGNPPNRVYRATHRTTAGMLRARLRAGRAPPGRARKLLAVDFSSAWRQDDEPNIGRVSCGVRPRDIPSSSLVDVGGLALGSGQTQLRSREFDDPTFLGTRVLHHETLREAWRGGVQGRVSAVRSPFDCSSRGFAASASSLFVDARVATSRVASSRRGFASSPELEPVKSSPTSPFSLGTVADKKPTHPASDNVPATQSSESASLDATDDDLKVDLHALDRAKAEIDALHLERQIKQAVSTWNKLVSFGQYVVSLGPWAVSLTKMSQREWRVAFSHGYDHFKDEMKHYWAGTKLLWVEIKIATRLLFKTLRGQPLTRRERRQMTRTTADVFRLVPFAAFVLIPFMEVFLPVAIKLFPGMLPTTFRDELKHEEELKKRLKAKLEVARFLQDTVKVMAKGLKQSRSGVTRDKADKLYDFMKKVRSGDATVTNDDITRFAKLFGDEFTLDHISRGQLTNMCKFVGLSPYGTDSYLRRTLKEKLKELKADDRVIYKEGLASLSFAELQSISRARGMRADTTDRSLLERHINDWLELSLNAKLPPSLLVLSRAFTITAEERVGEAATAVSGAGDVSWSDAATDELAAKERLGAAMKDIGETLGSLPEEVVISVTEERALASSRSEQVSRKLEFLAQEEELINEENAERAMEEEAFLLDKAKQEEELLSVEKAKQETEFGTDTKTSSSSFAGDTSAHAIDDASVDDGSSTQSASTKPATTAVVSPAAKKKQKLDTGIDSVSLDEVQSVVQGKRARRAAKLSRLLAALTANSALGVERKELTNLVRKELDMYGVKLKRIQKQLVSLEGDAAVAAAVAAEGDLTKAAAIEAASAAPGVTVSLDAIMNSELEEERVADACELIPDETVEEVLSSRTGREEDVTERLADPFEVIEEEEEEEHDVDNDDKGWFRAEYDAALCDRVNDRVNRMLANVKKDLDAADGKIGTKFKCLDADGDGKISPEELVNVKEMLKDALDAEGEEDLRAILAELTPDPDGNFEVADLSKLVSDLVEKELADGDLYAEDDYGDEDLEDDKTSQKAVGEDVTLGPGKPTAAAAEGGGGTGR